MDDDAIAPPPRGDEPRWLTKVRERLAIVDGIDEAEDWANG